MRYITKLAILTVVWLLMVGCTINLGGESSKDQNSPTQPSESSKPSDTGDLDINLLKATSEPDIDMTGMGGMTLHANLDVEIGNPGDKTVDFDEVRVIFIDDNNFVSGTRCAHAGDHILCMFWYEQDQMAEFNEPIETISLHPNRATDFEIESGGDFNINGGTEKSVIITALLKGTPLVSFKYGFPGEVPEPTLYRVGSYYQVIDFSLLV